jgi:hypothetical protein
VYHNSTLTKNEHHNYKGCPESKVPFFRSKYLFKNHKSNTYSSEKICLQTLCFHKLWTFSSVVTIQDKKGLSLSFKTRQIGRNNFSIGFVFDCETPEEPTSSIIHYLGYSKVCAGWGRRFTPDCYSRLNLSPSLWTGDKKEQNKKWYRQSKHTLVVQQNKHEGTSVNSQLRLNSKVWFIPYINTSLFFFVSFIPFVSLFPPPFSRLSLPFLLNVVLYPRSL